jgi:hypothetical protein
MVSERVSDQHVEAHGAGSVEELRDAARAIDEKVRSLIMALAFLVAGAVSVFFVGRGTASLRPGVLTWDGYSWSVANAFFVTFGFGIAMAAAWALFALDPRSHLPLGSLKGEAVSVTELRAKQRLFSDCQAFVWFAVVALVEISVARLPDTDAHTMSWVALGALVLFVWVPSWPTLAYQSLQSSAPRPPMLATFVVPALASVLLGLALAGLDVRWPAAIYVMSWLLGGKMLLVRSREIFVAGVIAWIVAFGLALGLGFAY